MKRKHVIWSGAIAGALMLSGQGFAAGITIDPDDSSANIWCDGGATVLPVFPCVISPLGDVDAINSAFGTTFIAESLNPKKNWMVVPKRVV